MNDRNGVRVQEKIRVGSDITKVMKCSSKIISTTIIIIIIIIIDISSLK
jgi:hypothetical protein